MRAKTTGNVSEDLANSLSALKAMGSIHRLGSESPEGTYVLTEAALTVALADAYESGVEARRLSEEDAARPLLPPVFYFVTGLIIGGLVGWLFR